MSTPRLVLSAVIAFALAWASLASFAAWARFQDAGTGASPELPDLSAEEIATHDQPGDCWIIVRGKVYDVTDYIPSHPAPPEVITAHCGKESTEAFETKNAGRPHSPQAWQTLETVLVGEVPDRSKLN